MILLALQEFQPQSTITAVLDTAVEILYAAPEKISPKSVLRLHNLTFIHAKLCEDVFGCPKTMSRRKMFGRYYHALTAHSPLVNRIISPCLLNAEVEERTFGQCKAITRATSNQHTNHIISNILVRLHYEKKRNVNASSTIQAQEGYVSKLVKTLPSRTNTLIPFNWIAIALPGSFGKDRGLFTAGTRWLVAFYRQWSGIFRYGNTPDSCQ